MRHAEEVAACLVVAPFCTTHVFVGITADAVLFAQNVTVYVDDA